jgi:redox-sensitive bicupin YhaK (pirin superfamily)
LILGDAFGMHSPVTTYTRTLYAELRLPAGGELELPDEPELAAYLVEGAAAIGECALTAHTLAVVSGPARLRATSASLVMLIGGDPVGPRHLWWNFVSSSRERIEQAKRDWADGAFAAVPGESEFIPLPD